MAWSTVYLILAIIVAVLGIWNIARQRSVFLSLIDQEEAHREKAPAPAT